MTKLNAKPFKQSVSVLANEFSNATIAMHEAIAKRAGLSGTDHKYLGILLTHGPMTAGNLASHTGLTTGAITGLVDRLEKIQLVKRSFDASDRRKILIVPKQGKASDALAEISSALNKKVMSHVAKFTDAELLVVEKFMESTIAVMHEFTSELLKKAKKAK